MICPMTTGREITKAEPRRREHALTAQTIRQTLTVQKRRVRDMARVRRND